MYIQLMYHFLVLEYVHSFSVGIHTFVSVLVHRSPLIHQRSKKNIKEMFIMFSFYLKRKNMPPSWNSIVMIEAGTFVPLSKKMELDSYILIQC